ncbi:hypothetical protein JHK85_027499 [Glycine max]|nr:hypothetical protein JHK85_027499 [Glycine max]
MEKGAAAKNQNSRICFLASLSAFFWFLLLYFHFVVLAGDNSNRKISYNNQVDLDHSTLSTTPVSVSYEPPPTHQVQAPPRKIGFPDTDTDTLHATKKSFPFMRAMRASENKSDPLIDKVTNLRKDIIEGRTDDNFIEENSWKYALLPEGEHEVGPHEWDPFFSKPKDGNGDSNDSSAEVAKNSWKNERRNQS